MAKKTPLPDESTTLPEKVVAVLRSARRAFGLLWATSPLLTLASAAMTLIGALIPAAVAIVGKWIIDGVVRAAESGSPADRRAVLWYVAIEFGLVTAVGALRRLGGVVDALLRVKLGQRVNEMILEKALTLSLADFEDPEFYDRMGRARSGASHHPLSLANNFLEFARAGISLATLGGLLVQVSPWAALVLAVATVPEFLMQTRFSQDSFRLFHWRAPETRKQAYVESVLMREDHAKEVKLFGLGPMLLGRYRATFAQFWAEDRALTVKRNVWGFLLGLISTGAFYGVYGWIALQAMKGRITVGDLGMYLMVFKEGQSTLTMALGSVGGVYDDHLYLSNLFVYLDRPPADGLAPGEPGATEGPDPADGIRFEDVSFTYPGAAKPALEGLNLHIPRGHKVALVGENGAGKTTLIKLMTRLYMPSTGRITLDGLDLRKWDGATLRRRVGVIFQDFVRYQFTVGENIGAGDATAFEDEARWREAAERGMASEFIEELPAKYRTQLGKWFEDGQELSLGQWQKIALARAFMSRASDILVLDEPTASMDAQAEARVFERFRALAAERTAVLISHRFSTVRMADSIAVIANGRVVEQGTHDELIQRGGRYAELFFLQAKGYR